VRRGRTALFLALAAYILVGPLLRQGFGLETPALPRWRMFHQLGRELWEARIFDSDGREILPPGPPSFVRSEADALALARKLCPGNAASVSVVYRIPAASGWSRAERRDVTCAP
jgi:hypothetical protein